MIGLVEYGNYFTFMQQRFSPDGKHACKKSDKPEENAVTQKWILCMFFAVFSNGMLGILSRLQQIRFENQCTNEYYIILFR